jgi:hypothetical protein
MILLNCFLVPHPIAKLFNRGFCEIKELLDKWCVSADLTIRVHLDVDIEGFGIELD